MHNEHCSLINKITERDVPLKAIAVKGMVTGLTASWQIIQKFANNEAVAIEAVFSFPLPAGATMSSLKILTGGRTIVTKPEEREKAFDKYDAAIQNGHGAYLLDQERPDFFVMNLGNILPGQQVEVQINMFELLQAQADGARVSFPVAVIPKYFPAADVAEITEWDRITPDFAARVPYGFSFALKIAQSSQLRLVESPSHPIRVEYGQHEADVSLYQASAMPDRDVIINFTLAEKMGPMLTRSAFVGREHLLFELFPEFSGTDEQTCPKEVVFVVDCSGSMDGNSIREAVNALQLCVRSLNEGDSFQVICFGSSWRALFERSQILSDESLELATREIAKIGADMGGTEILPALQAATGFLKREFSNLILFTDGAVGNEKEVVDYAVSQRHRCRIFSFGIGNGASESMIRDIADRTGGRAEFVFPGERIEPKVLRQFNRLSAPFLSNIVVTWGGEDVEQVPARIATMFSGDVVRIAARLEDGKALPDRLEVSLTAQLGKRTLSWKSQSPRASAGNVPALWWAQQQINILENGEESAVGGSRQKRGKPDKKLASIVKLSKEYGIISSQTSLVGVEERAGADKNAGQVQLRRVPVMVSHLHEDICYQLRPAPVLVGALFASLPGGHVNSCLKSEKLEESKFCYRVERDASRSARPSGPVSPGDDSKKYSGEDLLVKILMHAGADGMFVMSKQLLEMLGVTAEQFKEWLTRAPEHLSKKDKQKFAMTSLVKHYLENNCQPEKDLWSAIVAKCERKLQMLAVNA